MILPHLEVNRKEHTGECDFLRIRRSKEKILLDRDYPSA
jgi:hypothetical protein